MKPMRLCPFCFNPLADNQTLLEEENEKLRELCTMFAEYVGHDRCEGCLCKIRCDYGEVEECWQLVEIREAAHELGVEVHA